MRTRPRPRPPDRDERERQEWIALISAAPEQLWDSGCTCSRCSRLRPAPLEAIGRIRATGR